MKETIKICPICFKAYKEPSALSRKDNRTEICSLCGVREALIIANVSKDVQESILTEVRQNMKEG